MNPLGFKSAIYTLSKAGDAAAPTQLGVADDMLADVARKVATGQSTSKVDGLVVAVARAREDFSSIIQQGAVGARSAAEMGEQFGALARRMESVGSGMSGSPIGHLISARSAAHDVSVALKRDGIAAGGALPEAAHQGVWKMRESLDQAWNALGMSKALGTLPH